MFYDSHSDRTEDPIPLFDSIAILKSVPRSHAYVSPRLRPIPIRLIEFRYTGHENMDWTCAKESSVIKKEFRREAVYQLCREWGGTFAPPFLEKMAEDCDIHHIRPQFLGGPDSVENFCLMDKKTHQALHNHFKKQLKILAAAKTSLLNANRACALHSEKDILWNILYARDNEPAPLVPIYWPEGMCHIHELHGLHGRAASHPTLTQ